MNIDLDAIQAIPQRHKVPLRDRAKVLELSVAEIVASKLPIPATPVESLRQHFIVTQKVALMEVLAEVNEKVVVDIDRVAELTYQIWKIRYSFVHRVNDTVAGRLVKHAVELDTQVVPDAYHDVLKKYPEACMSHFQIAEVCSVDEEG